MSSWISHFKSITAMVGSVKHFSCFSSSSLLIDRPLSVVTELICKGRKSQGNVHIMAKDEFYNIADYSSILLLNVILTI